MTGGLGFVKSGQLSLENNRKLLNRDRNFKKHSKTDKDKHPLHFKHLSKGEFNALRQRYALENKRENRRNGMLLASLFILVLTVVLLLIF